MGFWHVYMALYGIGGVAATVVSGHFAAVLVQPTSGAATVMIQRTAGATAIKVEA
jgi:hypothetical protein